MMPQISQSAAMKRLARVAQALAGIPCQSAAKFGTPLAPGKTRSALITGVRTSLAAGRQDELAVFAFDLMHRDGDELTGLPLTERGNRLERLLAQSDVPCLHLLRCFDDGAALFIAVQRHGLEGIVSKRKASAYRSGASRDWVKVKTATWREANRERWRLFEKR
jgi:bifunctional non-homologous end joining protein LigD